MRRLMLALAVVVAVAAVTGTAQAQTVTNPTVVVFTSSPDHADRTKYVLGYFSSATTSSTSLVLGR